MVASLNPAPPRKFQFVGGELCLDFCNTVGGKRKGVAREYLTRYEDFVSWSEQAGLIENSCSESRLRRAARRPEEAVGVLNRSVKLRESIYCILLALKDHKQPSEKDVAVLNSELSRSQSRLQVAAKKEGFDWEWHNHRNALDDPLGPIARSAAELLTSPEDLKYLSQCQGDNCGWLFLDSSKNHSRCWCDMRDCGNRAKVRRHRLKHKKT